MAYGTSDGGQELKGGLETWQTDEETAVYVYI